MTKDYTKEQLIAIGALMEYRNFLTKYIAELNKSKHQFKTSLEQEMAEGVIKLIGVLREELDRQIGEK